MANKKKRNKQYKGSVAAIRPSVTKVSAVKRNPAHQWWVDHKRIAKPVLITSGIVVAVIVVIVGFIDIIL